MKMRFEKFECQKRYQIFPASSECLTISWQVDSPARIFVSAQPPLGVLMVFSGMGPIPDALRTAFIALHATEKGTDGEFFGHDGGGREVELGFTSIFVHG